MLFRSLPASEVELRAERLGKELKWRAQEDGWKAVRPGVGVSWDERFRGVLKVFESTERKDRGRTLVSETHVGTS